MDAAMRRLFAFGRRLAERLRRRRGGPGGGRLKKDHIPWSPSHVEPEYSETLEIPVPGLSSRLERLDREIAAFLRRREAHVRAEQAQRAHEEERKRKFWAGEERLLEEKLRLYRQVVAWRDEFVLTDRFLRLVECWPRGISIFGWGWGHVEPPGDRGCWSGLDLEPSAQMRYVHGYKWMPPQQGFILDDQAPKRLTHEYWLALHEHLRIGGVYDRIANRLKADFGVVARADNAHR